MAVDYNGENYYYVTNIQGDVVVILNSEGAAVVTYTYDAWGNILSTTGTLASTLGVHNPLRYRGYVYDQETGLYYLQSRYYNPEMGRFISADSFVSTGQGILGNNMLAYCLNNPVCRKDIPGTTSAECYEPDGNLLPDEDEFGGSSNGQSTNGSSPKVYSSIEDAPSHKVEGSNYAGNGEKTETHHVVEQCQGKKSGFSKSQIRSPSNTVVLGYSTHRQISGFYSSKPLGFNGLTVRDWLAGQSFEAQTAFGWRVINYYYSQQFK